MIAAVYARKSTDQVVADEAKSVRRQIEHAREYASRKGWTVADQHVYVDDGISGAEFQNRPGFVRLMNALKPRAAFQVLIVSELSRLGREQLETGYACKQLSQAGVRIVSYLEDREIVLESAVDVFQLAAVNFAAAVEQEKARQRAWDSAVRRAKAGYVAGGRVFGYENVRLNGHVERRIVAAEAAIVRRIFELSAAGYGLKAIAKQLNIDGALSPRSQLGRSRSWVATSVREALHRDLYRGVITWNRTRKRDRWGAHHQKPRPTADWVEVPAPSLRIVPPELWDAVHARFSTVRQILTPSGGRPFGRPPLGGPSKFLLTNLALCGLCGGPLRARSRKDAAGRYGCSWYHERGRTVCTNNADVPMAEADHELLGALLKNVLDPSIVRDAVDEAVRIIVGPTGSESDPVRTFEREIAKVEQERARLISAIAAGGMMESLLSALRERETKLEGLRAEMETRRSHKRPGRSDVARIRGEVVTLAREWRHVLADDPNNARPIVTGLLIGRVTIAPTTNPREWKMRGEGTLAGLFERTFPSGWRPRAELNCRPRA